MTRLSRIHRSGIALLAISLLTGVAVAKSPERIEGVKRISADELIALVNKQPDLVIIDSRVTANRKHGYIEGSYSLPDIDTTCDSLQKFIPSKSTPAAFYCNGVKCGRSAKALKLALDCGYRNLYWFRGGFEVWKQKNFPYLHQQ